MRICIKLVAAWLVAVAAQGHAATITYFHNDFAGSPIVATDQTGTVIWRESYRPYGERVTNAATSSANKIWFTSRRQDVESGLVYMGARYYDPVIGRFMSPDPVQFVENNIHSFNRYAYGNNNPFRFKDANGRWAEDIALAVPGLVMGAVSLRGNLQQENYGGAAVDVVGMLADAVAVALPGVPGGFGLAIAATRTGAKAVESSATVAWSNSSVKEAAKSLEGGAKEVAVRSRAEAEELFLGIFQGQGFKNTTDMSAMEAKQFYGSHKGTYHWDVGSKNHPHGIDHLQIHTHEGDKLRINFQ